MAISFHSQNLKFNFNEKAKTKKWLKDVICAEKCKVGEIAVIFCSDEYLLQINKEYLKHDYLTDVITFDYTDNSLIAGDIFISIDRIRENAVTFEQSFEKELSRIILHGVLHLIGFKDKNTADKEQMTAKEDEYLRIY